MTYDEHNQKRILSQSNYPHNLFFTKVDFLMIYKRRAPLPEVQDSYSNKRSPLRLWNHHLFQGCFPQSVGLVVNFQQAFHIKTFGTEAGRDCAVNHGLAEDAIA